METLLAAEEIQSLMLVSVFLLVAIVPLIESFEFLFPDVVGISQEPKRSGC